MNPIIEFKGVTKTYPAEAVQALSDISFSVDAGQFVSLIGSSGCGKSTILKIIIGLEKVTTGTLITPPPEKISMVFQSGALFPWLTAADNVSLALVARGVSKTKAEKEARDFLATVNLSDFADKYPADLSGGQRQRVGIARALAVKPAILLLDEPFSALDPQTTAALHDDLHRLWKTTGITVVMVSHIIEEAVQLAQKIILMKTGTIAGTYSVDIPYPRREQEAAFIHEVSVIRKAFFS